ncbi:MAG: response regulator, partial [Gammaproteobacteria bacterium]
MKSATLRFALLLLITVGGLSAIVTLHVSSKTIDMDSSIRVLRILAELDGLNAEMNRNLLQASVEAQPDAEAMLESVVRFEIAVGQLPDRVPGDIDSEETRESWARMKDIMREKKLLIQDYVAAFAVQRFAAKQMMNLGEDWLTSAPDKAEAVKVSQLLNQIRQVGITGDETASETINQQLAELALLDPTANPEHYQKTIKLLDQAFEVLALDSESTEILTNAFAQPIRESIAIHAENYIEVFTRRIEEDKHRDDILFYLSVSLGGVVLVALIFMWQQARVLARTLKELNFQRFAVDQHALVSITDPDGKITYANQLFTDLSGYTEGELLGENHQMFRTGEQPPEFYEELWRTIKSGQVWHGQLKHRAKSGDEYWVESTIVPFMDSNGRPERHVFIRTDITPIKRMEMELAEARVVAEAANEAKSAFLANMSHEIRTPMNAIIGMSNLALDGELSPRQRGYIEKVQRASESLLGIINDILDFSKIEAGRLELEAINFQLSAVIDNLASLLGARVAEKELELLFDIEPGLPRTLVGDPLRLGQVLTNLCTNAVKFTEEGEIVVRVSLRENLTDGRLRLAFEISDTGIGMTREQRSRLFQSFSQADVSTTRKYGGTGLGLAISKQLVEAMGGEIDVSSEPGQGSTFHFDCVFGVAEPEQGAGRVEEEVKGLRILVADDNDVARELYQAMLRRYEHRVAIAENGRQAVDMALAAADVGEPYELLLMDWKMPEMDGVEAVQAIQTGLSQRGKSAPPVVMSTAFGRADLLHAQKGLHVDAILSKPVTQSALFDAIVAAYTGKARISAAEQQRKTDISLAADKLRGARILLVEDNAVNQELAQELLSRNGMMVSVANNGQEALDKLNHQVFDGVLMDGQMPVMDGYTAARKMREKPHLKDLPVIAMTADVMAADKERCLEAGMNDFIPKPINLRQMLETMARWISPSSKRPQTPSEATDTMESEQSQGLPKRIEGIDMNEALEIVADDEDLLKQLLSLFKTTAANFPEEFAQAQASGDPSDAARVAHSLKGAAGNIAALRLAALTKDLEWAV